MGQLKTAVLKDGYNPFKHCKVKNPDTKMFLGAEIKSTSYRYINLLQWFVIVLALSLLGGVMFQSIQRILVSWAVLIINTPKHRLIG